MSSPILATKILIPPLRARRVHRRRLTDRLDESVSQRLTLVSAPAGFGKTSLLTDWAAGSDRPIAWVSLDEADRDPRRFLADLIGAIQTVESKLGQTVLGQLQSAESPSSDHVLADLINEVAQVQQEFTLVMDDYHVVDSGLVDAALTFLLDHLPRQMHLVVAAREDPQLPLARYRSRGHLVELREADLRFAHAEAAEFLNQVMGLSLSEQDIMALESRTEGWIVGLQLAALSSRVCQTPPGSFDPSPAPIGSAWTICSKRSSIGSPKPSRTSSWPRHRWRHRRGQGGLRRIRPRL